MGVRGLELISKITELVAVSHVLLVDLAIRLVVLSAIFVVAES